MAIDDEMIVERIMDKAAQADRRALFAAVQAALGPIIDTEYGMYRGQGLERVERALDVGAEFGSPEQIAHIKFTKRLIDAIPDDMLIRLAVDRVGRAAALDALSEGMKFVRLPTPDGD
jgi:hypothetical protein